MGKLSPRIPRLNTINNPLVQVRERGQKTRPDVPSLETKPTRPNQSDTLQGMTQQGHSGSFVNLGRFRPEDDDDDDDDDEEEEEEEEEEDYLSLLLMSIIKIKILIILYIYKHVNIITKRLAI